MIISERLQGVSEAPQGVLRNFRARPGKFFATSRAGAHYHEIRPNFQFWDDIRIIAGTFEKVVKLNTRLKRETTRKNRDREQ